METDAAKNRLESAGEGSYDGAVDLFDEFGLFRTSMVPNILVVYEAEPRHLFTARCAYPLVKRQSGALNLRTSSGFSLRFSLL